MGADRFEDVSRVVAGSLPARALRHAAAGARASAPSSRAAGAFIRARHILKAIPSSERIRLSGVVLLTTALTHDALLRFVPEIVRPAVPRSVRVAAALTGLAMLLLAPALERAWRMSRIRRTWLSQSVR